MHQPRKAFYPTLETFGYRNHEFYRYRDAYLPSDNEEEIVRIIADAARDYKAKEMGEFRIGIRTPTPTDAEIVVSKLLANGNLSRLIERAKASLKKKDDIALLDGNLSISRSYTGVFTINFK